MLLKAGVTNENEQELQMKLDIYNLLVTDAGDGGDTARNEWSRSLVNSVLSPTPYKLFSDDVTQLVRNPKPGCWWSDPTQVSRDQTLHAFTYLARFQQKKGFKAFHKAHWKRWYMCQNGTDTLLGCLNVILRASGSWFGHILLPLLDLVLIVGVMQRCYWLPRWNGTSFTFTNDPDDVGDDLNLQMSLVQPGIETGIRRLARWIYTKYRPCPYLFGSPINVAHACWTWYYRNETRNSLWIPDIWKAACFEYFS
jgi:hypothetical protein